MSKNVELTAKGSKSYIIVIPHLLTLCHRFGIMIPKFLGQNRLSITWHVNSQPQHPKETHGTLSTNR
jgi:hypothetical protein